MSFLVRVDTSEIIGTGHLMRCLALAQALQKQGQNVAFLCNPLPKYLTSRLKRENLPIFYISNVTSLLEDAEITISHAKKLNAKWVIIDGYKFNTNYQLSIKRNKLGLLVIDDIAQCHFVADIVLNQNLNAAKLFNYSCAPYTVLLLGTRYALLRREFFSYLKAAREIRKQCSNILITLGGGNWNSYILEILRQLHRIESSQLHIRVIMGSYINSDSTLEEAIKQNRHIVELLSGIDDMAAQISWCDLALSAGGSTVWELAALSTPMILGVLSQNQLPVVQEIELSGACSNLGWFKDLSLFAADEQIEKVILSYDLREQMSARASLLCDGSGAAYVLDEITKKTPSLLEHVE